MNSWIYSSLVFLPSLLYTLYINTIKPHIFFCCCFGSWDCVSLYSQAGLELAMYIRQTSNSKRSVCLFLWQYYVSANRVLQVKMSFPFIWKRSDRDNLLHSCSLWIRKYIWPSYSQVLFCCFIFYKSMARHCQLHLSRLSENC